jgi:hypothetical protein
MRRGLLLLLVAFLSACAAQGPMYQSIKDSLPGLAASHGRVFYYRNNAVFGSGMKQYIFLDEEQVGKSQAGGTFFVDVKPGEHVSSLQHKIYSGQSSLKFTIEAGETKYIETWLGGSSLGGRINQGLKPAEIAVPAIAQLSYTGKVK